MTVLSHAGPLAPTLGTAYFTLSPAMVAFYAARGMWANGQPCSTLAGMLGPRAPWGPTNGAVFFVSAEQMAELAQDISLNGRRGLSGQQFGQALRRLREAAVRAGGRAATQLHAAMPSSSQAANLSQAAPFEPLTCPPPGSKARRAFEHHLMQCLREVITLSQESIY